MELTVGERLRKFRKSLKLSQEKFAEPLDVSGAAISLAENNNELSAELAEKIQKAYKINLEILPDELGRKKDNGSSEGLRFAEETLKRIEDAFKKENEFLKEQIRQKDEIINKLMGKSSARNSHRALLILPKDRFLAQAH